MNQEQVKSIVRWVITTFGAGATGWLAQRGIGVEAIVSVIVAVIGLGWSVNSHTEANTIVAANAMPLVQGVITVPTKEGKELAASIPEATVAVAGSPAAEAVALK